MLAEYFWAIVPALAALVALIDWIRSRLQERWKGYVYPFALVVLTAISTYQFQQNHRILSARAEARTTLDKWPAIDHLDMESKGALIGIILGGMTFIEKHKADFPQTYESARALVQTRLNGFRPPKNSDEDFAEYHLLRDVAGGMIELIETLAEKPEKKHD
jgi:hypothetical protein